MKSGNYYKKLFLIAAIWNWLAGVSMIAVYKPMLGMLGESIPDSPFYLYLFMALVIVMGLGFYYVSLDLENIAIVKMGVTAKMLEFFIPLAFAISGRIQWISMLIFFVDLVFGLFFLEYLIAVKKK